MSKRLTWPFFKWLILGPRRFQSLHHELLLKIFLSGSTSVPFHKFNYETFHFLFVVKQSMLYLRVQSQVSTEESLNFLLDSLKKVWKFNEIKLISIFGQIHEVTASLENSLLMEPPPTPKRLFMGYLLRPVSSMGLSPTSVESPFWFSKCPLRIVLKYLKPGIDSQ